MASPYRTLITAAELMALQRDGAPLVVLDCGFDLMDTEAGAEAYAARHLPGAFYAHLDRDLSGPKNGRNGRHPLPRREAFAQRVAAWGIGPTTQVVTYDEQGGPQAARAWWMLRWLGHEAVAVLDGGLAAWGRAGGALSVEAPVPVAATAPYPLRAASMPRVDAEAVAHGGAERVLLDARAPERFRGAVEPLDPVAGHIPGAVNRFFKLNLGADGSFKPAAQLRAEFGALLGGARETVHTCGSGVTACHNLLAMAHAGLGETTLYPGSWSEWCADPSRPVERD